MLGNCSFLPPPLALILTTLVAPGPWLPLLADLPSTCCSDVLRPCCSICIFHSDLLFQMYLSFPLFILNFFAACIKSSSSFLCSCLMPKICWHNACLWLTGKSCLFFFWCFSLLLLFKPPPNPLFNSCITSGLPPLFLMLGTIWSVNFFSVASLMAAISVSVHWTTCPSLLTMPWCSNDLITSSIFSLFLGGSCGSSSNSNSSVPTDSELKNLFRVDCFCLLPPEADVADVGDAFIAGADSADVGLNSSFLLTDCDLGVSCTVLFPLILLKTICASNESVLFALFKLLDSFFLSSFSSCFALFWFFSSSPPAASVLTSLLPSSAFVSATASASLSITSSSSKSFSSSPPSSTCCSPAPLISLILLFLALCCAYHIIFDIKEEEDQESTPG